MLQLYRVYMPGVQIVARQPSRLPRLVWVLVCLFYVSICREDHTVSAQRYNVFFYNHWRIVHSKWIVADLCKQSWAHHHMGDSRLLLSSKASLTLPGLGILDYF